MMGSGRDHRPWLSQFSLQQFCPHPQAKQASNLCPLTPGHHLRNVSRVVLDPEIPAEFHRLVGGVELWTHQEINRHEGAVLSNASASVFSHRKAPFKGLSKYWQANLSIAVRLGWDLRWKTSCVP